MNPPPWYKYIHEFFLDVDHKHILNFTLIIVFLLRRLVFVTAAIFATGSPALQAILFVLCSMTASTLLLAKRPYSSRVYNLLEIINELVVLCVGYLVLILTWTDLDLPPGTR